MNSPATDQVVERTLRRYVHVWLWSVVFGAVTGVAYSFIGVRLDRPWGQAGFVLVAIMGLGSVAALGAWLSLYRYLRFFIIPLFFQPDDAPASSPTDPGPGTERVTYRLRRAAFDLRTAFLFLTIAALSRLLIAVLEIVYASLGAL